MKISFYATFRPIVGGKTVDIALREGATVRDLIEAVVQRFPDIGPLLLDEAGELSRHVHVFIDGRGAPYLEDGLASVLSPDQKVDLFPAVAGG